MKVVTDAGVSIDLGETETGPTIGITDYSRRETDDYGVTTVVERGFARTMSVRFALPVDQVDAVQRQLAALRAAPATWIADDRYASLGFRGFFKDFSLDVAFEPTSYCTLTVEGLASSDAGSDPGGDPAPVGASSSLRLLQPVVISDANLVSSSVPENDAPAWSGTTTYALAAHVIRGHRVYESAVAANVGNDPAGSSGKWIDVGPTNRWAMVDQALGTASTGSGAMTITLNAGAVNGVALLDVLGTSVRVQAAGFDRSKPVVSGIVTFLDMPATGGDVTITIAGDQVAVGTLLIGKVVRLGVTGTSATAGITDYSRKDVDDFGEVTIVQRAWAKRMTAKALIRTDAVDAVANRIAAVRALPSLWIGDDDLDSLKIYGFFKDFSIEVGETASILNLTIEGLSTAAKPGALVASIDWPSVGDPEGTKPDDNADVTADALAGAGIPIPSIKQAFADLDAAIDANDTAIGGIRDDLAAEGAARASLGTRLAAGAVNLCTNGGFERGLDGIGGDVAGFAVGASLWGVTATAVKNGTNAIMWPTFDVQGGEWYTIAGDTMLFATGGSVYLDILFLRADGSVAKDGAQRGRAASFDFSIDGSGRLATAVEDQAPGDAVKGQPRFVWTEVTGCQSLGVREVMVERGRLPASAYEASTDSAFKGHAEVVENRETIAGVSGALSSYELSVAAQFGGFAPSGLKASIDANAAAAANATESVASDVRKVAAFADTNINLCPDVDQWTLGGGAVLYRGQWGTTITGPQSQSGGFAYAVSPLFDLAEGTTYTLSCDLGLFASAGDTANTADIICYDASGNQLLDSANTASAPVGSDFSDARPRSTYSVTFTTPAGTRKGQMRGVGYRASGTIDFMGLRLPKVERGAVATAYTTEGSVAALSASVIQQAGAIAQLNGRVQAYWQVRAVAGDRTATIGIIASDGAGGSYSRVLISGANIILDGDVVATGTVMARVFVTDQGVGLAALIPGQFAWKTAGAQSMSGSAAKGGSYGPFAGTGLGLLQGHELTVSAVATVRSASSSGTAPNGDPIFTTVAIMLAFRIGNGAWQYSDIGVIQARGNGAAVTASLNAVLSPSASGPVQYGLGYRVEDDGDVTSADAVVIGTWSVSVKSAVYK